MKAKWFCEKVKKQLKKTFSLWTFYRVSHRKLVFLNKLGEIETWKLDFFGRWFWNPEIWEILPEQPVFMKSILCAIYGPICKLAKNKFEKKDSVLDRNQNSGFDHTLIEKLQSSFSILSDTSENLKASTMPPRSHRRPPWRLMMNVADMQVLETDAEADEFWNEGLQNAKVIWWRFPTFQAIMPHRTEAHHGTWQPKRKSQ